MDKYSKLFLGFVLLIHIGIAAGIFTIWYAGGPTESGAAYFLKLDGDLSAMAGTQKDSYSKNEIFPLISQAHGFIKGTTAQLNRLITILVSIGGLVVICSIVLLIVLYRGKAEHEKNATGTGLDS